MYVLWLDSRPTTDGKGHVLTVSVRRYDETDGTTAAYMQRHHSEETPLGALTIQWRVWKDMPYPNINLRWDLVDADAYDLKSIGKASLKVTAYIERLDKQQGTCWHDLGETVRRVALALKITHLARQSPRDEGRVQLFEIGGESVDFLRRQCEEFTTKVKG